MKTKNRLLTAAIFLFIGIIFVFLPYFLTDNRDTRFWISMSVILFALVLAFFSTDLFIAKRRKGLVGKVTFLALTYVYFFWTIICALVFDTIFSLGIKAYVSIHIALFSLVAVILLLSLILSNSTSGKANKIK